MALATTRSTEDLVTIGSMQVAGNDKVRGGYGNDVIQGGWGIDSLSGNAGDDVITGDPLDILPGASPSVLHRGNDTIDGGSGNDSLRGMVGKRYHQRWLWQRQDRRRIW